jgi:hypothetical protein
MRGRDRVACGIPKREAHADNRPEGWPLGSGQGTGSRSDNGTDLLRPSGRGEGGANVVGQDGIDASGMLQHGSDRVTDRGVITFLVMRHTIPVAPGKRRTVRYKTLWEATRCR